MADVPARTEIDVTTGPIRGSRKIHVGAHRVAMREIDLEPSLAASRRLRVYDTSGPYTDPAARDRHHGRPARAAPRLDPRPRRRRGGTPRARSGPRITASSAPTAPAASRPSPTCAASVLRAKPGANVSQMHYARRGIITPEMEYVADPRESRPRARSPNHVRDGAGLRRRASPITSPPNSSATKSPAAARSSPPTSTTPKPSRWRSAATSWSRSTPISATPRSPATSPTKSTRWSGRSAGAPTR